MNCEEFWRVYINSSNFYDVVGPLIKSGPYNEGQVMCLFFFFLIFINNKYLSFVFDILIYR